ncbi:C45 family autoproteolytic acyltransferase/hydolase [Laceyella putida]|uniref:C45 family autoproteolytic acyltransferase/hydrolase n=1 Tax=Laceyella putida TaxID=110101 RepID=A0ABW2RP19_9BACL
MEETKSLPVVECYGTPYEIGMQIGNACKGEILFSLEDSLSILARGYQTEIDHVIAEASKFIPATQAYDPELIQQLQGQADALGISFQRMFALRTILELSFYYRNILGLCTSFAASGKVTADGKTILGQNIDWYPRYSMYLLKIHHRSGIRQLALSLGGIVEYTLSSAGFGMCANSLFTETGTYRFNIPLACYLPKVMRQFSFKDAVDLLQQMARGVGYYHLASASGEMVGIESVFDDVEMIEPHHDLLFHTNCYCTERFQAHDMAATILPDSLKRRERMQHLLGQHAGSITPETMMKILSDHQDYPVSICRHPDPHKTAIWEMQTLASFIMVPEEGIMYIANGNPCSNEFLIYSI